jgi:hypothetical protein
MVAIEKNPASEATRAAWAEGESEGELYIVLA